MDKSNVGLVGLAVMGENLALNIESRGFSVAVFNRTWEKTEAFLQGRAKERRFTGARTPAELVAAVERPRRIVFLVKAGAPVDDMIGQIAPFLDRGDILIDGGNSYFEDTRRRGQALKAAGIEFIGSGVSGGEEGALKGPSLMPGGPREAYERLRPVWEAVAAKVDDGPCCAYIGPDGAGHFVKMVHNGIEYGDMQLIAESYHVLRAALRLEPPQLAAIFTDWNNGPLSSYLIEITARVFRKRDEHAEGWLVDFILDKADQKGTGKWMVQAALDLGVAIPTIHAAVEARIVSSQKDERVRASHFLFGPATAAGVKGGENLVNAVRDALYASKICSYAQGMALMQAAGRRYRWDLNLGEIARIWKGGCIIRARFLDRIKSAYRRDPALANLMLDEEFRNWVAEAQTPWRFVVQAAQSLGIPVPAMAASLAYYDSIRAPWLPQNLTQAQRDFFGAHTYERTDKPGQGPFHTNWSRE